MQAIKSNKVMEVPLSLKEKNFHIFTNESYNFIFNTTCIVLFFQPILISKVFFGHQQKSEQDMRETKKKLRSVKER